MHPDQTTYLPNLPNLQFTHDHTHTHTHKLKLAMAMRWDKSSPSATEQRNPMNESFARPDDLVVCGGK